MRCKDISNWRGRKLLWREVTLKPEGEKWIQEAEVKMERVPGMRHSLARMAAGDGECYKEPAIS